MDPVPSSFNSTLTLALPPKDNSLMYEVGVSPIGLFNVQYSSPVFGKPSKNNVVYYYLKVCFCNAFV